MADHLRGRDAQLDAVLARLARLRSGSGCVVVIEGGPGYGKTRLLRESAAAARDLGINVGHGMADPLDRVVELAPWLEALFDNGPPLLERRLLSTRHTHRSSGSGCCTTSRHSWSGRL